MNIWYGQYDRPNDFLIYIYQMLKQPRRPSKNMLLQQRTQRNIQLFLILTTPRQGSSSRSKPWRGLTWCITMLATAFLLTPRFSRLALVSSSRWCIHVMFKLCYVVLTLLYGTFPNIIIESKELFSVCPKEEIDYWKQSLGVWGFKRLVVSGNMV